MMTTRATRLLTLLIAIGWCSTAGAVERDAPSVGVRGGLSLLAPDRVPYGLLGAGLFLASEVNVSGRLWVGGDLQIFGAMCAGSTGDTCGIGAVYLGHVTARVALLEDTFSLDVHAIVGGLLEPIEGSPDSWAPHLQLKAEGGLRTRSGHLFFVVLGANTTGVAVDAFEVKPFVGFHLNFAVWHKRNYLHRDIPDKTLAIVLRGNVALEQYPALGGELGLAYLF